MKTTAPCLFLVLGLTAFPIQGFADFFIGESGQQNAEILIAEDARRTTRLAAAELQSTLEKISISSSSLNPA